MIFYNDIFKFIFHSIMIYCVHLFLCTLRKMSKWFSITFSLQKVSFHKGTTVKNQTVSIFCFIALQSNLWLNNCNFDLYCK